MAIRVLTDRLINQIAAGEVVERPASVVKELMENSLDAGATRIEVEIEDGGQNSILVIDNGSGIPAEEMALAFTRHATSKLSDETDLVSIATMGFRGEALPSIASVAKVKMVSSVDGIQGYALELANGEVISHNPHPSPPGTMVLIQDLFYNVPARRKFLKSPVTEALQVYNMVFRLAVAHPDVEIIYRQNGRLLFKTPGTGEITQTVNAVKGSDYSTTFLPVTQEGEYQVNGIISLPEYKRKNRREEIFLINGRPVHSALLLRAVDEAYRGRLTSGEYPACYLHLQLPPEEIDVNVHPQKTEVRFRNEDNVFRTIANTLKMALDHHNQQTWYRPNPVANYLPASDHLLSEKMAEAISNVYATDLMSALSPQPNILRAAEPVFTLQEQQADYRLLGQVFDSYLLTMIGDNLILVDQHAADESLRYHELINRTDLWKQQDLLFPITLIMGRQRVAEFETIQESLAKVGFGVDLLGEDTLVLRSAPAIAQGREEELFLWLLEDLFTGEISIEEKEFFRRVVASLACHQAVKANQRLERIEMELLLQKLMGNSQAAHCPHGRPTYISIPRNRIAEWFKR